MVAALIIIGIFTVVFLAVWMIRRDRPSHFLGVRKTLPASSFPERADVYICDKCARDMAKHFRLRQSHTWAPIGPTRFTCRCGQRYVTGAIEWDHLALPDRHRRVWQTFVLGIFLSGVFSIFGILIYFALRFLFDFRQAGFLVSLFITVLPFVWLQITFWPEVLASMWRTKVASSVQQN